MAPGGTEFTVSIIDVLTQWSRDRGLDTTLLTYLEVVMS